MPSLPFRAIAGAVLSLALVACGHTPPTFEVVGARLAERTDDGVVLEFDLDATNTNPDALPLEIATYSLSLDGRRVFSGTRSPEATLRRYGTQRITLPAAIPVTSDAQADAITTGIHRYQLTGSVTYLPPGALADVLFDARIYRPSAGFSQRGQVDFDAQPEPAAEGR